MLNNLNILITGGTGSFGRCFVDLTLKKYKNINLIIYSRDEMKQWEMSNDLNNDSRVKFVIGDVRDVDRLIQVSRGVDLIIHAAATKIVPTAEYNPFECIKTNINGAMNVIDAAHTNKVKKVIALSTDKASNPINLYGATKLASDKLFVAANYQGLSNTTQFSIVRYGNVMGSRGSIIPFFLKQKKEGLLTITDPEMTRFMISLEDAVSLVIHALDDMLGGEIYIKKIPSMKLIDIADAIAPKAEKKIIGIRPGEKLHEQMISIDDSSSTYEYDSFYKILPMIHDIYMDANRIKDGTKVNSKFQYLSNLNNEWMTKETLQDWISKNLNDE
jgi:UDP-N-acetylglucosamine 4,6-dehydratase